MTLLSAHQDFVTRTLVAFDSAMERLRYIAELRNREGKYEHWGLAHIHGDAAAQAAMHLAHQETMLEVLRTPVRELFRQETLSKTVRIALSRDAQLLPQDHTEAAALHFNSMVLALSALARARAKSTHRAA